MSCTRAMNPRTGSSSRLREVSPPSSSRRRRRASAPRGRPRTPDDGSALAAAPAGAVLLLGHDGGTAAMFVEDGGWVEAAGFDWGITRARRDAFGSGEQIRGLPHPSMWEADPP